MYIQIYYFIIFLIKDCVLRAAICDILYPFFIYYDDVGTPTCHDVMYEGTHVLYLFHLFHILTTSYTLYIHACGKSLLRFKPQVLVPENQTFCT